MFSMSRSTYPAILKLIWLPILELLPFFHQFIFILILFVLYFKNYLEIDVKFKLQKCATCQDLPTLQFWSKSHYPFWPIMQIRKKGGWNLKKIFSSETTEPISTKLCWNDPKVVPFQNCVRHFRTPTKMATTAELNLT